MADGHAGAGRSVAVRLRGRWGLVAVVCALELHRIDAMRRVLFRDRGRSCDRYCHLYLWWECVSMLVL